MQSRWLRQGSGHLTVLSNDIGSASAARKSFETNGLLLFFHRAMSFQSEADHSSSKAGKTCLSLRQVF